METVHRPDGWWIVNVPDTITECGPYDTRADAEQDRRGMAAFFRRCDDLEWMEGAQTIGTMP